MILRVESIQMRFRRRNGNIKCFSGNTIMRRSRMNGAGKQIEKAPRERAQKIVNLSLLRIIEHSMAKTERIYSVSSSSASFPLDRIRGGLADSRSWNQQNLLEHEAKRCLLTRSDWNIVRLISVRLTSLIADTLPTNVKIAPPCHTHLYFTTS